ncbi:MAG: PIG-L deacetylase family protein [Thermodesulfovibrio sp.]|nr:PIG-L deacetylase family protein [Thermodesulfovibrio sp.]
MRKILVVAPHPDDETLGCGGTLLKHREFGDELFWLILTNIKDKAKWGERKIEEREKEIESVSNAYRFKEVFRLDIEPTKVKEFPFGKLVEMISNVVKAVKPDVVYVHNRSDVHSDHRVSFEAVMSAVKIFNNPYIRRILMYETLSETNFTPSLLENVFLPNYYVDISDFLDVKVQIAEIYKSEIKEHPFPRSKESIKALAILRGSEANVKYAEAFILLRGIW